MTRCSEPKYCAQCTSSPPSVDPHARPPSYTREQLVELHALELKAARTLATWRRGLCIWDDVLVAADMLIAFEEALRAA